MNINRPPCAVNSNLVSATKKHCTEIEISVGPLSALLAVIATLALPLVLDWSLLDRIILGTH